jgi:tripartite-type tricarboxylate transporter receptor subunit TctC
MCGLVGIAAAQADYPNKPIRFIVSYPPGGSTDVTARVMGQWLSQRLGQSVVVENRGGGGNNIGTEAAVRAAPDGYTIFLVNPANAINATLYSNLSFNFLNDMAPVAGIIRVPNVMTVTKNFPAKTVAEFIKYAKDNPGKVNMASSGSGTSVHLSGEMFKAMAGIDMKHIPYKGAGPATTDLIGGQVDVIFDNMPSIITHIRAGTVRALGVTTLQRSSVLPAVPTIAESGLPGYDTSTWGALLAPAGTPKAVVAKLNAEVVRILALPDVRQKLQDAGIEPGQGSPEQVSAFLEKEMVKWAKVAKDAGIQPE